MPTPLTPSTAGAPIHRTFEIAEAALALINRRPRLTVRPFPSSQRRRTVALWSTAVIVSEAGGRSDNDGWRFITTLVLDGISSLHTRRAYAQARDEFLIWFHDDPNREFNKAAVQKYRAALETKGLAPSSINVRLSAICRLASEAADNGPMPPELAAGIARAKGAKLSRVRLGIGSRRNRQNSS